MQQISKTSSHVVLKLARRRVVLQEGDLDSAIKKYKGYLPEDDIMLKFVQIALALHYTHSKVRSA